MAEGLSGRAVADGWRPVTRSLTYQIRVVLDRMDDLSLSMEEFNELDTEFHVSGADAGDNQLVADMARAIRGAVRDSLLQAERTRRWVSLTYPTPRPLDPT